MAIKRTLLCFLLYLSLFSLLDPLAWCFCSSTKETSLPKGIDTAELKEAGVQEDVLQPGCGNICRVRLLWRLRLTWFLSRSFSCHLPHTWLGGSHCAPVVHLFFPFCIHARLCVGNVRRCSVMAKKRGKNTGAGVHRSEWRKSKRKAGSESGVERRLS